jgi:hypothetical protein
MILVDKPFVSDFLKKTIEENNFPVVKTESAVNLGFSESPNIVTEEDAILKAKSSKSNLFYSTSENSIEWIAKHLSFTDLPLIIDLFKNKMKFRSLTRTMYPNFYFREVLIDELNSLSVESIPLPFIIKPTVGFFSMGVFKVTTPNEWQTVKQSLISELASSKNLYPTEVLNTNSFIIEQCIEGEEFAFDAYFNTSGEPIILNIFKHVFSSSEDVSDRVYITSKEIIESNIKQFSDFLSKVGKLHAIKNFPIHVEIRCERDGSIIPIEINPLRFGGWCTTADMTYMAYGFNPYVLYFSQTRPDWSEILKHKEGKIFSIVVLDNSTGIAGNQISSFNYDLLLSGFENTLELRKINHKEYPIFGFLFTETRENRFSEIEKILKSDLKEFITVNT